MIFSLVALLLVAVIAFFHYVQGFVSAMFSAVIAIIAAAMAISFHEALTTALLRGYFADQATAITLISIFAVVYLLLRVAFDNLVPGNVRLPAIADKIGA